jgi:hypothetical protein
VSEQLSPLCEQLFKDLRDGQEEIKSLLRDMNGSVKRHDTEIALLKDHEETHQKWTIAIALIAVTAAFTAVKEWLVGK